MLKFNRNTEERKTIAARLGELTGMQPFYTRAPRYAYEVGPYTIDRDGDLFVDEEQADADILTALMNEGLITGGEVVGDANEREPDTESDGMQEAREIQDGAGESEEIEDPESTESDMTASDSISDEDASEESVSQEPQSDGPDTEETDHAAPEDPEDTDGDAAGEEPLDMNMNFEIPLGVHTGATLRNLVNLIYSRGPLVNQATGGHFEADAGLIEALKDDRCTYTRANFFRAVADYEDQHGKSLYGLTITPETVSFTGNEKYAMRIWLVRIGMDGEEFKQTRKILMEKLTGHSAFRTPAEAEKAKAKAQKKRDELRAAKEAARLAAEARETGSVADASPMEVQMIASGA